MGQDGIGWGMVERDEKGQEEKVRVTHFQLIFAVEKKKTACKLACVIWSAEK